MNLKFELTKSNPYPVGVICGKNGMHIVVTMPRMPKKECGMLLYSKAGQELKIPFPENCRIGLLYAMDIKIRLQSGDTYVFYCDEERFVDPFAKSVAGREQWGKKCLAEMLRARIPVGFETYDWEDDRVLEKEYADSILYSLHVRGFTKHSSSGVSKKGTFEGLVQKIPYLKELGITAIECMPIYEFDEIIPNNSYEDVNPKLKLFLEKPEEKESPKINYWGFADRNVYYLAPKASYAGSKDPTVSLRNMVKELHKNDIEIIMQMCFPAEMEPGHVLYILRYWVENYHIDGFHLMGVSIPMELLGKDSMLCRTKLITENTRKDEIYRGKHGAPELRNLATYRDDFRCNSRKFLKGDEDMLNVMSNHLKENDSWEACVHHIADYRGFTLMDLVSYDRKHNENNGEENRDGSDYNYSWNCGAEGPSRKKSIWQMRLSQRKNILAMLLLSQATPLLMAGDEFGHSKSGNNNAYCQDNAINWLNWKPDRAGRELLRFTKSLIAFRKEHPILHMREPVRMTDYVGCGYPDLSFHGESAWFAQFENYNRHFGVMLSGAHTKKEDGNPDDFLYLGFNMHWIPHQFALPNLPNNYAWEITMMTEICEEETAGFEVKVLSEEQKNVPVSPRSMVILTGKKQERKTIKESKKVKKEDEAKK